MYQYKRWSDIPKTIDEAAELLISELSVKHQEILSNLDDDDFDLFYQSVAKYILDNFALWSGNDALLHACYRFDPTGESALEPAKVILNRLRETLQVSSGIFIIT